MDLPHSLPLDNAIAHIHIHPGLSEPSRSAVLFILHGHPSSARHMKPIVDNVFDLMVKKAENDLDGPKQSLFIVTFVRRPHSPFMGAEK
jgi:hypothetical protein